MPVDAQQNKITATTKILVFISPLDPLSGKGGQSGPLNYLFSAGTKHSLENNNGIFFKNSKIQLAAVPDGTSNTFMIGETLIGDGSDKAKTVKRQHVVLDAMALKDLNDNSGVKLFEANENIAGDRGHHWIQGKFLQGTFTGTLPINDAKPDVSCGGAGGLSALRTLGKGVNISMGDGSVRFVSLKVSMQVWQAACTRDGGEAVNLN
jgi:prepilin-type processing-associated H-X9-DG protein